jgi:hypothetical protein
MDVVAGPLIDFSQAMVPDWLWVWEGDLSSISSFMCDYVETVINRYRGRIRSWQLTAASNCSSVLALAEDELLWLTARLVEAARQVDSRLDIVIGISQPWGEYLTRAERTHSPILFADTLIRSGINFSALDLELVMGVNDRGSYCRDIMDTSRILDLYSLLGMPLRVSLGYPSTPDSDPFGHPDWRATWGCWPGGFSPAVQEKWADQVVSLALCKPNVRGVQWVHLADALRHQFPHCGLFDAQGNAKPVLNKLRELREHHLR